MVLFVSVLLVSWLWMQAVHELGHVLHAWATGGTVQRVVLHPMAISFTDVRPNPQPLAVAWGGVLWGCLLPLLVWAGSYAFLRRYAWLAQFFAGFCLIANGVYLAAAMWEPVGDVRTLQQLATPLWLMSAVGVFVAAAGIACCTGLGPRFGWKRIDGEVDTRVAWAMATLAVITIGLELVLSPL